jgi:hypothetical protein
MRYFRLGAAVIAAMFIGAASAHAQILLYSFEAGDSPNSLDGFSNLAGDSLSNSTTVGVTNGLQSLFVTNPSPSFAGIATNSNVGLIQSDTVTSISMDATIPSGESYTGGYYLLGITLYDEVAGNPYTGDSWQVAGSDEQSIYQATGNGVPQHITIPLTGSDPNTFAATTYGQLVDNGWVTTGFEIFQDHNAPLNFAIDNVTANEVPEPATLGIGAVSGLLLLARRRRAASR